MPQAQPLEEKHTSHFHPWLHTIILSIILFVVLSAYLYLRGGSYDLFNANQVFATVAVVLIGLSLALSGICYFWDFADTKLAYRKQLGLAGFAYAIVHIIIILFFLPDRFTFPEYFNDHMLTMIFGALALLIFLFLAAISNQPTIARLGSVRWRLMMRYGGYAGFVLVVAHFIILSYRWWVRWFESFDPWLPPLSLLTAIFSVAVIILRIALWIALRRRPPERAMPK